MVFYAWQMYGQMDLDQGVCLPLPSDIAYSYKVFTVPSARRLSICSAYYDYIKALLERQGYRRLICRVDPTNEPSLRAHLRAGFRHQGSLWKFVVPAATMYYADRPLRAWFENAGVRTLQPKRCPSESSGPLIVRPMFQCARRVARSSE